MSRLLAIALLLLAASPVCPSDETKGTAKEEKLFRPFGDPVGDFKLQERSGKYVRARDLLGKIWVVQFFYPGCNLCSRNTPTMKKLQDHYRGKADVRFVSIALNSDSLETLQEFAKDHEAEPDQWLFLTGPEDKVHDIVRLCFFNMVFRKKDPAPGDVIAHSTYLVLVDSHGTMVGFVEGTEDKAAEALKEQIDLLRIRRRLQERIPVTGADLPWFNALLNSTCTVLLLLGWIAIRLRYETLHKIAMLLALAVSMAFLASYLFYHFAVMEMEPMRFGGTGAARYVYFTILLSHTILAIVVAPLALFLAVQGLRDARLIHKKVARWTLPIWLYVSVTGVVVYWMLYRVVW
jgi:protein SCO1/2/putative membrane protein